MVARVQFAAPLTPRTSVAPLATETEPAVAQPGSDPVAATVKVPPRTLVPPL